MITHVAIRCKDGTVFCILKPNRHCHLIREMTILLRNYKKLTKNCEHGFMATHKDGSEHFLNRCDALDYAYDIGQIKNSKNKNKLYSGDLW